MAVPVYMPADPEIGAEEVPAVNRTATFARDSRILMRESKTGSPWAARFVFATQALVVAVWLGVIGTVAFFVGRGKVMNIKRSGRRFRVATA